MFEIKMKLTDEQCKKLYEIVRNSDEPEWIKLYPQQKTALRSHYQKAIQMIKDEPYLYKRSDINIVENVIDEILATVK